MRGGLPPKKPFLSVPKVYLCVTQRNYTTFLAGHFASGYLPIGFTSVLHFCGHHQGSGTRTATTYRTSAHQSIISNPETKNYPTITEPNGRLTEAVTVTVYWRLCHLSAHWLCGRALAENNSKFSCNKKKNIYLNSIFIPDISLFLRHYTLEDL